VSIKNLWAIAFAAIILSGAMATVTSASAQTSPPPLEVYGSLPAIDHMSISPGGKFVAFLLVKGGDRRVVIRHYEGGPPVTIVPLGKIKVTATHWAGDEHLLVFMEKATTINPWANRDNKFPATYVYSIETKTAAVTQIFAKTDLAPLVFGYHGVRKIQGRWVGYFSGFPKGNLFRTAIYQVDLITGAPTLFLDYPPERDTKSPEDQILDDNGKIIARSYYNKNTKEWSLYAGASGEDLIVRRPDPEYEVSLEGLGRTPDTVLVSETRDHQLTVEEFPIRAGGQPKRLFDGVAIQSFIRDPASRVLIGVYLEGEHQSAVMFDPSQQTRMNAALAAFPGYEKSVVSMTSDLSKVILMTDGKDDAGTFWQVDLKTGKADDIGEAYPSLKPENVASTEWFRYKAGDGLDIAAVLTLPRGKPAQGLPLIVMPHGGPISFLDILGFDWWAQAFASRGYAVLQPNFRGSGGYGVAFQEMSRGEWGRKMQTDLSDGVFALAAKGVIDAKRVCIVGASYGGYAALAGVTLQHGVYRCAVSVAGLSDLGMPQSRAFGETKTFFKLEFGNDWAGSSALTERSPLFHAEEADAPILMIHGKDDTTVPITHSQYMQSRLEKAGKIVEYIELEGEDHNFWKEETRRRMVKASVDFVEKYNPD